MKQQQNPYEENNFENDDSNKLITVQEFINEKTKKRRTDVKLTENSSGIGEEINKIAVKCRKKRKTTY